jgi:hypothetical protein
VAFARVAGNQGANTPGVDGVTAVWVGQVLGMPWFLDDLRAAHVLPAGALPRPARYPDDFVVLMHGQRGDAEALREVTARVLEPLAFGCHQLKPRSCIYERGVRPPRVPHPVEAQERHGHAAAADQTSRSIGHACEC